LDETTTDEQIVEMARKAAEGDYRAFETLVQRHKQRIVANCRYISRSPNDAEDLAQEVFVKAFFALRRFESRAMFKTWLHRIKINHCLNDLKKREGKTFLDIDDSDRPVVDPHAEKAAGARDEREEIGFVLDSMNDTLRVALIMRDMDELSYQEIADELKIGLSATKMRIKRAREEFRDRYNRRRESSATPG